MPLFSFFLAFFKGPFTPEHMSNEKKKTKFHTLVRQYNENEDDRLHEFLACNGFDLQDGQIKGSRKRKKSSVSEEDKNAFVDEMFSILVDFAYDSYLLDSSVERDHLDVQERPTLHDILSLGPSNYISMNTNMAAEGEKEREAKHVEKSTYVPTKPDIRRAHFIGGAVEMSRESKDLLSTIIRLNEANQIQKASALAMSNKGRVTLMQRDLVLGHNIDGYDTVSV